jgi:hypothetical protein
MIPRALHIEIAATQTTDCDALEGLSAARRCDHTCTQSRKKFRLKSTPDKTYLFVTVIIMEDPQYAKTAAIGFSVMATAPARFELADRVMGDAARNSLPEGISTL